MSGRPHGDSRNNIFGAAACLMAVRGFDRTTTSAIARAAGTSESQMIKHFSSKEGILVAIMDQFWNRVCDADPKSPAALCTEIFRATDDAFIVAALEFGKAYFTEVPVGGLNRFIALMSLIFGENAMPVIGIIEAFMRDRVIELRIGGPCAQETACARAIYRLIARGATA
jgi:AcrR family transcriptional regulator